MLFTSACVPVFVPLNEFNEINLDLIPPYFDYLYENGIRSFFVNGTCGEFSSLTMQERKKVLEKWMGLAKEDVQIVVNIGTSNLDETIELGNHALTFDTLYGIAIVPPFYMSINNEENLLDYLISVANGLTRKVPILYYHFPSLSKVDMDIKRFLSLVKQYKFYQLAAVKCTDSNFDNFMTFMDGIKSNNLSINMYCGYDTLLSKSVAAGAAGAILGSVNMKPKIVNSIINKTLPESQRSAISSISNMLTTSVEFSQSERVNLTGLLKIATEFSSNVNLGPMRKPYVVAIDKEYLYRKLLKDMEF